MNKLLLAACAFGMLLPSAFAQEKSPEQYREESSHIWGVEGTQKETVKRVVASGKNQLVGFLYAVNPDCTASGDIDIRITKQTEHGSVEIASATRFPNFPKENIRARCNSHKVRGMQVNYKSAEKYVGDDTLDLLVLYPGGFAREFHLDISVH
jgi:hypothetical protein